MSAIFQLFHKWRNFKWTKECIVAFVELKQYLSQPPVLSQPRKEGVLYSYIVVTDHEVSLVLVKIENGM